MQRQVAALLEVRQTTVFLRGPKCTRIIYGLYGCLRGTHFTLSRLRSQTAMDNGRRLAFNRSKAPVPRAGNAIGFQRLFHMLLQKRDQPVLVECKNIPVSCVYVSSAATGNATVNFTLSGTATNNRTILPFLHHQPVIQTVIIL